MRTWRIPAGRWWLGVLLWSVAAGAVASTTLYKWVDENGVTHYSDRPEPGAQRIKVASAQSYKGTPAPASDSRPQPSRPASTASYTHLEITNPEDGAVLWNTGGRVDVGAVLEPELADGHQLWFLLDGKSQQASPGGTASLEVPRGSHTLSATVTDATGKELITSAPINFVVHQTSIARPPQGPVVQPVKPKP